MQNSFQQNVFILSARAHRPVGFWLLLWPSWWGCVFAPIATGEGASSFSLLALLFLGAFLMRSAGCVYNDLVDKKIDAKVSRTAGRPIASGLLSRGRAIFLMLCLLFGAAFVVCQLNLAAVMWAMASLVLVGGYPWMKRLTFWPQLFLGFTFNWGIFVGWAATGAPLTLLDWKGAALLYATGIFWTLAYDTLYAFQDYADDSRVGVKSSAVRLGMGKAPYVFLMGCWCGVLVCLWGLSQLFSPNFFYFIGVFFVAAHFFWQGLTVRLSDPRNCGARFRSNQWVGFLIFLALWMGYRL